MSDLATSEIEIVADAERAATILDPLRLDILSQARNPISAAEVGRRLHSSRQKINYHFRELEKAGFLRQVDERRVGNLMERRYVATAHAYLIAPEALGPLSAEAGNVRDRFSASYLLALAAQLQSELGQAVDEARQRRKRLATLSLNTELRFESPEQRQAFTEALEQAVVDVVGRFSSPAVLEDGRPGPGRPYRLVLGCYPVPAKTADEGEDEDEEGLNATTENSEHS